MGKASSLFNGAGEQTLLKRVSPTEEQRTFLQEQWNDLAEHLKVKLKENYGYPISTWIQGSYKFGTLIRPVKFGEEYDVDLGVYFDFGDAEAKPAPDQIREWVQDELYIYRDSNDEIKNIEEPPKERCSRATYRKQFHIDTPVYELIPADDYRRLACLSGKWEESDPKKIYKWFRDLFSTKERDALRRVIRYLKGWAAVAFEEAPKSRPSSILLTVLAADAFQESWYQRLTGLDDDDWLTLVVRHLHARFQADGLEVQNPVNKKENLNRISREDWDGFLSRLQAFKDAADRAEDALDEASAALIWSEPLSYLMPLPDVQEVEVADDGADRALMVMPEISIQTYRRNPKQLTHIFQNEVTAVAKGSDLIFTITNPHVIPDYATIEWTVRNDGDEASYIGDLGHRTIGYRQVSVEESTSYTGLHYMDCIVRLYGQVYAVRRVPVHVIDAQYPPRNPPKPSYTKIRSRRRR